MVNVWKEKSHQILARDTTVIPNCAHDDEYETHGNFGTLLKAAVFF
jgi:hypothetical protein